ncbi:MAG TPA: lanthionine synthetase LanC family protein [Acidimicrobiales bacterium]|nr:lanthionine synthetase LanC family protein [Acidimicrobiales bacterium]
MNYREAALGASEWLLRQPVDDPSLYDGGAGVILALLDAHAASDDGRFRSKAEEIGAYERAQIQATPYRGFYVGLAGMGFALRELGDDEGVRACIEAIPHRPPISTDIIYGDAGTILFLLREGCDDLVAPMADWLVSVGESVGDGMEWRYDLDEARYMPGFSHGTAGIAYALAAAGRIDEAVAGARYLVSAGERTDAGYRIYHWRPGGEEEFPLGWCHGPAGTARLFQLLADKTGEMLWHELRDDCARTVRASGIPERKQPGFWDNVASCCGSTGVAKFFLGMHRRTGDHDQLAFARLMADDIVSRAAIDDAGVRWSNVEHRAPDPVLPPDYGQMQGAAGIAQFLFELDRFLNGDGSYRRWPDDPF